MKERSAFADRLVFCPTASDLFMKPRLLCPGPTPVPEETLLELARPVTFHRSAQFRSVLAAVVADLQLVFCTKNPICVLTSSGTGGMEAALTNVIRPGTKVLCCISGRWGERWKNIAKAFGATVVEVTCPYGEAITPDQLTQALKDHPDAAVVTATLSETSTGVRNDIQGLGAVVKETKAVFIVDAISGLGVMECRTDDWAIDFCVTGSQKALMLPAGLAFVAVSEKGWKRVDETLTQGPASSFYFDLRKYRDNLKNNDTPFTPANTLVKALTHSLARLKAEGMEKVWHRHERMAAAARAAAVGLNVKLFARVNPTAGLTVYEIPAGIDGSALLSRLEKEHGIRIAGGQDTMKGKIIRLAHMGYIDFFEVLAAVSALEMVLADMGHKVESSAGVAAAQRAFASWKAGA